MPALHIGLPKTATTLLQSRLFPCHSQIEYLGKFTGKNRVYRDQDVQSLIAAAVRNPFDPADFLQLGARWRGPVSGRLAVWSSEDLTVGSRRRRRARAENLFAALGPCRVVITLRHPLRLLESLYLQLVRGGVIGNRAQFGVETHCPDVRSWLQLHDDLPERGVLAHLDYAETIKIYESVFGRSAVGVFVFEELVSDVARSIRALCNFLGVDEAEGVAQVSGEHRNERWSQDQLHRVQQLHASAAGRRVLQYSPIRVRRWLLRSRATDGAGARVSVPDDWSARIQDEARVGNQWLINNYGLPLAVHGYPL